MVIVGFAAVGYKTFGLKFKKSDNSTDYENIEDEKDPSDPPTITTEELKEKIDRNEDIVIIDIQTVDNYLKKHIPNALSIPQEDLVKRYKELPKDKEIIVTSAGEKVDTCDTCTQGARALISFGFSNIKNFKEGVLGWESKGYAVIAGNEVTYKNIDVDGLKLKIDDQENVLIIDIRDEEEFNKEHIKGAIYMPFENIISRKDDLSKEKEIIIYDKAGYRSKLVTESLVKEGFLSATNLLDGFKKWKEKGYPVEN
jgi:hydroxyacylglutathione hydrolase